MARGSRRNTALKFYINGERANSLHGMTDAAGRLLSAFDTSVIRATVSTQRKAVAMANRAVRDQYGVKLAALAQKFRADLHSGGTRGRGDYISLWASTRGIPLLEFGGRWTGPRSKGATASIEKGRSKTYDSAFIAVIQGRRAIRVRSHDGTGRRFARGPVRMLYGPSPFEMISGLDHRGSRAARDALLSTLRTFYLSELHRQFKLGTT